MHTVHGSFASISLYHGLWCTALAVAARSIEPVGLLHTSMFALPVRFRFCVPLCRDCMSDWRWFWVSPRLFLIRMFRRYQAHQDKHQTFFAIVRVISITSVSWMFCTSIIWPVYDSVMAFFSYGGTKPNADSGTGNTSKSKGNGKDGAGASSRRSDGGPSSTAAKKFAAEQAAKIARGPKSGKALTAAEIAARAEKAAKRRKGT